MHQGVCAYVNILCKRMSTLVDDCRVCVCVCTYVCVSSCVFVHVQVKVKVSCLVVSNS